MADVLIAMSGGVDSSVAAFLALQEGHHCIGATMRLYEPADTQPDVSDAEAVASRLGIRFHVLDFRDTFHDQVIRPFIRCYEEGGTPSPCIDCNRTLKFHALLEQAQSLGCSHIATGHYAQIRQNGDGRYQLLKAADKVKDQSYFLYALTQEQLSRTLFPLGELTKEQARHIAEEQGFINAKKRDSQDICFIPDGDYLRFMEQYTGKHYPAGDFLDLQGNVVGQHRGAVGYTLGQRKGLGLAMGEPVYVCSKCMQENTVTVGPEKELFRTSLLAENWNWVSIAPPDAPIRAWAKARSRMTEQPVTVYPEGDGRCRVVFDEPQRALTPGQAVVVYDGDAVLGGGTITAVD